MCGGGHTRYCLYHCNFCERSFDWNYTTDGARFENAAFIVAFFVVVRNSLSGCRSQYELELSHHAGYVCTQPSFCLLPTSFWRAYITLFSMAGSACIFFIACYVSYRFPFYAVGEASLSSLSGVLKIPRLLKYVSMRCVLFIIWDRRACMWCLFHVFGFDASRKSPVISLTHSSTRRRFHRRFYLHSVCIMWLSWNGRLQKRVFLIEKRSQHSCTLWAFYDCEKIGIWKFESRKLHRSLRTSVSFMCQKLVFSLPQTTLSLHVPHSVVIAGKQRSGYFAEARVSVCFQCTVSTQSCSRVTRAPFSRQWLYERRYFLGNRIAVLKTLRSWQ